MSIFDSQLFQNIAIVAAFGGGVYVLIKSKTPYQAIKNLEISNKSYEELDKTRQASIEALELKVQNIVIAHREEVLELTKTLADLQGQIKVYKELPLQQLATGIEKVVTGNDRIVQLLENQVIPVAEVKATLSAHQ